ncbi:NAD(P)/FAD-dependent oxidoreductase [Phreatobacter sp. AB_2022a]|uniref:NAD(P)/FAD-dependent oxidoreductase n=1 Tax=Phreatobacter sp. AB_2022a TaxID=3003134 RepID=UPI002286FF65|nr:NAD(P)/FAD-dependent oxidoreductase [Phreatobacter sp. AB_2022a]MCZ0737976.1 NAD(P)/FAD-dependent oxidoreductase [Phreatobacter sp. AB_2022a]
MNHDAIVVGGSFAGLSAAMPLARAGRDVCVLDSGRPRNRFASASHGFFAADGMPPLGLVAAAREKLGRYPSVRFIDTTAVAAEATAGGFAITLADGDRLDARRLVLAFGLTDDLPDIPGLAERWGQSVIHCPYCHGFEFIDRPLGVLATMPMSSHQASLIPEWGPTTFFLNGGAMPDEETCGTLAARGVTIEPAPVVSLHGASPMLDGVRLADGRFVAIAALYLAPRTRFQSPLAEQLGCAVEAGMFGPVITTDAMKLTSVPGVYAAGDIARPMHNATFASADGFLAGTALHQNLVFG